MEYDLVVLDLDDTLLTANEEISDYSLKIISEIRKLGVRFTLATGRMFASALPYAKQLDIELPIITYNGAYIRRPGDDKPLYHRPLEMETAGEIIAEAEKRGLRINFYQNDRLYVEKKRAEVKNYERIAGVEAREVGRISNFISESPTKLLIIEDDRVRHQKLLKYFKEKYTDLEIVESKPNFIEFDAPDVSKGSALRLVTDYLGIERKRTVGIGDSGNDISLVRKAGLGIAMGNSPEEVKQAADRIAADNENHGVARILADIFLETAEL
ncbi:MAG: Cof-type HAD-IIB family hydrolase [Halanaerobiaceae bacterium]